MMIITRLILLGIITMSCSVIYSARAADSIQKKKEERFMREMSAKLTEFSTRELKDYNALCKSIFGTIGQEPNELARVSEEQELSEEFYADDEQDDLYVLDPELARLQKRDEQRKLNKAGKKHKKRRKVSYKEESFAKKPATEKLIADIVARRAIGYSTIQKIQTHVAQKKESLVRKHIFPTAERIAFVREQQKKQVLALRAQGIIVQRDNFDELVYGLPPLTQYNKRAL